MAEDLRRASEELAAGQVAEAQSLVEAVLALAPDHADARACRDEIEVALQVSRQKAATDRAARLAVEAARRQFDAGEHAAALALLEAINPPHPLVSQAHEELSSTAAAIERQRKEVADRARREAIQAAVDHARKTEDVDGALAALDEALALDPAHPAALAMRERLLDNREETRRRAEHDRQAQAAIAEARRLFVAGEISRALDALTQFAPPHPAVNQVLEELNARAAELERQRQLAEARREREAKLREVLTRGSDALAAGNVAAAMRLAGEALAIDRDDEGARALHARAQLEQRRRDEENERLRAESERAARQRRVDEACANARDELSGGRITAARNRLERIQRTDGPVASVAELIEQARPGLAAAQARAREEARRQAEADARQKVEAKRREQQRTKIKTLAKDARRQLSRHNPALALQRI